MVAPMTSVEALGSMKAKVVATFVPDKPHPSRYSEGQARIAKVVATHPPRVCRNDLRSGTRWLCILACTP